MDKFYVITNNTKDEKYEVTKAIKKYIEEKEKDAFWKASNPFRAIHKGFL